MLEEYSEHNIKGKELNCFRLALEFLNNYLINKGKLIFEADERNPLCNTPDLVYNPNGRNYFKIYHVFDNSVKIAYSDYGSCFISFSLEVYGKSAKGNLANLVKKLEEGKRLNKSIEKGEIK